MVQTDQIKSNLSGLIGFRQSVNPDYAIVNSSNLASSSGSYYQEFSPIISIANIKDTQQYADISDADFNTLLTNMGNAAMSKVISNVFLENDFVENKVLFEHENVWTDTIGNNDSFVGYEITVSDRRELLTIINKIGLSFDGVQNVKILLFHSSQNTPIQTETISSQALSEVFGSIDWSLDKYLGGKWYIGYVRGELSSKAINREWDSANIQSCFNTLRIEPIIVDGHTTDTLFDINNIEYSDETYGMNFDITTMKDYTNLIIQNRNRFVNAFGLQFAVDVADLILKSTRSNRNERSLKAAALLERDGILNINEETQTIEGLYSKLNEEVKRLRLTFIDIPLIQRGTI